MSFIFWTIWFVIIAVLVNILMESLWSRIVQPAPVRDDQGSLGKHRSGR